MHRRCRRNNLCIRCRVWCVQLQCTLDDAPTRGVLDRKYIAVVRGSYSAVYSTKGASARSNPYSGGGYNEKVYRYLCLEGTTGYYSPFETYAIVSIAEIDNDVAIKENLKPIPTPKRGIEIMELMPEAKGILSEEKYYLSIN